MARIDVDSPPIQLHLQDITKLGVETQKEEKHTINLPSLKLLNSYGSGFKRLNWEKRIEPSPNRETCKRMVDKKLSAEDVMRVSGEMFIRGSYLNLNGCFALNHLADLSFAGLSNEEAKDVELAHLLLASAEELSRQQYGRARILLNCCDQICSQAGNPVQRLVYHFSEALREKIDRETRKATSKSLEKEREKVFDIIEAPMDPSPTMLAYCVESPFGPVMHFPGIHAIIDNIAEAKKVHIIDFRIRTGAHWTALMEAVSSQESCLLELLRITVVGTTAKQSVEDTGKRLMSFAQGLGLPLSFNVVMVSGMLDLKEDLFDLDVEETIAVYAPYVFETMIVTPNQLEHVIKVLRNIDPCVMVIIEAEANLNSPTFVNRFMEAIFFYSAHFDCFDECMGRGDQHRVMVESMFFGEGIKSIIAKEGEERKIRHAKIDVWRAFFSRYRLVEVELSSSSMYQAELILKESPSWSSCTLGMNVRSLIAGWKVVNSF